MKSKVAPRFVFFTASYAGDLERFVLMRQTLRAFCQDPIEHVVVVPKRDRPLFEAAAADDPYLRLEAEDSHLLAGFYPPWWYDPVVRALPPLKWRLTRFAGRRGWIRQQVLKLAAAEVTQAQTVLVIDSDNIFVSPFSSAAFIPPGAGRYLVKDAGVEHREHLTLARNMLGSPAERHGHSYIGSLIPFEQEWLSALLDHLQKRHGMPWKEFLLREPPHYSEYTLYGTFVEEILRPADLVTRAPYQNGVWVPEEFEGANGLVELVLHRIAEAQTNGLLCVTVQSNLHHDAGRYQGAVLSALGLAP